MKKDMHLHATFALALAAKFPVNEASLIARSALEVDKAFYRSPCNMLNGQTVDCSAVVDRVETIAGISSIQSYQQWSVWAPFHFIPALQGDSVELRMICGPSGPVFDGLLEWANQTLPEETEQEQRRRALVRLGVACHVICDSYSHSGFSGIFSKLNKVVPGSISYPDSVDDNIVQACLSADSQDSVHGLYGLAAMAGELGSILPVGHVLAAGSRPDIPFLVWQATFKKNRPEGSTVKFDNPSRFLNACEAIFKIFAEIGPNSPSSKTWEDLCPEVKTRLGLNAEEKCRSKSWDKLANEWNGACNDMFEDDGELNRRIGRVSDALDSDTHWEIHAFNEAAISWREKFKQLLEKHDSAAYSTGLHAKGFC